MSDIRNYVNPQPPSKGTRFTAEWQLAYLPDGETYTEDKSGKQIGALIRSLREGSIVRVRRLFILGSWFDGPRKRRNAIASILDEIKDKGGIVLEMETGRRSDRRGDCSKMLMDAYEDVATAGRSTPKGKTGRPAAPWTPAQRLVMESLWRSRAYKNDTERVAAIQGKLGRSPGRTGLRAMFGAPSDPPKDVLAAEVERPKYRAKKSLVYFIQNGDAVKIGISSNPKMRMADMAVGNHADLKLLGVMTGGGPRERHLHKKFDKHHIRGEWYKLAPEILEYIRRNRRKAK